MPVLAAVGVAAFAVHAARFRAGAASGAADAPRIVVTRDVAYGSAPAERLDVYSAATPRAQAGAVPPTGTQVGTVAPAGARARIVATAPVVIFVHGGAYLFGRRSAPGTVDGNVGLFAARHGCVGINADYRLAPGATWPAGAEDVARMVAWAHREAWRYGGDPDRIVLVGHSAGATHVADYLFDRRVEPQGGPAVAGAVLASGRYALAPDPADFNRARWETYFGDDPRGWADREPIAHVAGSEPVPVELVVAGRENPDLAAAAASLRAALCRRDGSCPPLLRLAGETHGSEAADVGETASGLGSAVLAMIGEVESR